MFIDKVRIYLKSGKGGDGCVSFRREKFIERGGPDGGNGGKGGDIYLRAVPGMRTLLDFTYRPHFKAEDGQNGMGKNKNGRDADDLYINVPCGTCVYKVTDRNKRVILGDLKDEYSTLLVARGGRGGRGNLSFKTQQNRAPRFSERGEPSEEVVLDLELKLIADVGIIGCPNAGKSTLLSCVTKARPKIADYPFTTVSPNLGVAEHKGVSFVMVDIPGLIKDAHSGKGLGDDFLRHIERTKILVHLIDINGYDGKSAYENYKMINTELKKYSRGLLSKHIIIAVNKMDIAGSEEKLRQFKRKLNRKLVYPISAITGKGIGNLLDDIIKILPKAVAPDINESEPEKHYIFEPDFKVIKAGNEFIVKGRKVERFVAMTNFNQIEGVKRLINILKKIGVEKVLKKYGVKEGDTIRIGDQIFSYSEENSIKI